MNAKAKKSKHTESSIITMYMDHVLKEEKIPRSIYKFCKLNNIKEEEFYTHFGSISGIQKGIWKKFYENTQDLMEKNKEFQSFTNKDKMLTFLFSFFELITLNRSYVLFALETEKGFLGSSSQLSLLRRSFKAFATTLINDGNADKSLKILQQNPRIFSEGAWIQFVLLLKFWMDDDSAGFEKTDVAIEKSVNTVFELFDNAPIERLID
ncbi:MAG: TetR/AcrR family transcriptional regulator, partial [Eudoraea sp.]|nr:TetR/AcrR family transcriptional regulator [Eudoraea sp.]